MRKIIISLILLTSFVFSKAQETNDTVKADYIIKGETDFVDYNNPKHMKAFEFLKTGLEKFEAAKYENAITDFDSAVFYHPGLPKAYLNRGSVYYEVASTNLTQNKTVYYQNALKDFNKVIELTPDKPNGYYNRGLVYKDAQLYSEAITDFQFAIDNQIDIIEAYTYLGICLTGVKKYSEAEKAFNKAIELDNNDAEFYYNRSVLYATINEPKLQIKDLEKVVSIDSDYPSGYHNLAYVYRMSFANYQKAVDYYTKSLEINPDNIKSRFQRSKCYGELKEYDNVITDLDYLVKRIPTETILYEMRIETNQILGNSNEVEKDKKTLQELKNKQ